MDFKSNLQKTLGDSYTLEHELEGGGMARVFVARDQHLGRKVVVKTLADDSGVAVSAERFRREIRLAASLQQANIVPVHSAGDVDGVPYYTMPYVEGQSLRAHMDSRGALDVREAVNILRDVARALAFAHDRGVVHRDIKPENILLSGSTAVVTDFGIAKAIEASHSMAGATTITQLGTLLGTPAYISPEQAAGDPHVDHLADIYSLGVVAYEMLAGCRPFAATAARALLAAHVSEMPPPLALKREGLPPRLASLVMRCLEKEPAARPQKAGDLLDALEGALAPGATSTTEAMPSIAVLPFANLSPDAADGFFADGLTDEIITDLSGLKSLRVIARAAMMRYRGTDKEPAVVARELRVRYVLDGSVRRAADSLRLTARLLDTETDATVWSDKLSGKVEDVFEMQERVSRTIVNALQLSLSPKEERRLAERPIADVLAYEAYLQARQSMWSFSVDSMSRAKHFLDAARSRIGENARLIAALGNLHLNYVETGSGDGAAHLVEAWRCAERLGELEPDSFSLHALRGALQWRSGWIREAIASLRRALELEPNSVDVGVYLAYAYLMAGQDDRARELADSVPKLDPITPLFQVMGGFCDIMAGKPELAIAPYRQFAEADPTNPMAVYFYLAALSEVEDIASAVAVARSLGQRFVGTVFGEVASAYSTALSQPRLPAGFTPTAAMRAFAASSDAFARPLGVLLAQMGAHEAAIDALECSVNLGLAHYPYLARNCRALAPLRDRPRFRKLLEVVRERWERGGTSALDLNPTPSTGFDELKPGGRVDSARTSVAILPFANLSPDPENEFFAEGITDDLIAQVAKISALRVTARTSVMRYRGVPDAARTAGKELGVTSVVEGTVRRAGNRARIVAQLVDSSSEETVWSETYDRDLDDIFSVQTEVATSVARALKANLTSEEKVRLTSSRRLDSATYDLYLLGRHHANRRTDESLRKAISYFREAIARDPKFAAAHAGLADAYLFAGLGYATMPAAEAFALAKGAVAGALALDSASPEALCAEGLIAMQCDWDVPRSRRSFERAIELNPNAASGYQLLAWSQFAAGDYVGAVKTQERALELDPMNISLITESAWPYTYAGLHEIALKRYLRAVELDPGYALGHYNAGSSMMGMGNLAGAIEEYQLALAAIGRMALIVSQLAIAKARIGARAEAEKLLEELREQARSGSPANISLAMVADELGLVDEALDALERAHATREPFIWSLGLEGWLQFPNARRTPRFKALCDAMGIEPHDVAGQRALLLSYEKERASTSILAPK